jgi:hypothetical protein
MEEDEKRDEEVCETVEDDVAGHADLGKVSPTPTIRLVCVASHLQNTNKWKILSYLVSAFCKRFDGKR